MKHRHNPRVPKALVSVLIAGLFGVVGVANAAPTYTVQKVLVADDQWTGENSLIDPKPIYLPHETDASLIPSYWLSSNERDDKAGITVLKNGTNAVLAQVNIEEACIPVVQLNGTLGDCAPPGAEEHPRHPHGVDIDAVRKRAYQVAEHSGLRWNADRTGFEPATSTDDEAGLLVVYDIKNPSSPTVIAGYVLGHASEESAVNELNGKVYVGNHEPTALGDPEAGGSEACFVSVVKHGTSAPYAFIDLPADDCVQGVEVNESLQQVFGTTHIGEKMYAFRSSNDSIAYSVDIRAPFVAQVAGAGDLLGSENVLHMHDLTTSSQLPRVYQTIHTLAPGNVEETEGDETATSEIDGRWVAEVDVNPKSKTFKKVTIIDLSNGQTAQDVPSHEDATGAFEDRFVHAHFVAVDPARGALLVTGEHTGNLGVVNIKTRQLTQVVGISRPIPGCELPPPEDPTAPPESPEPHVHGVNIQTLAGTAYVSDEGEDCFYESVTVLQP